MLLVGLLVVAVLGVMVLAGKAPGRSSSPVLADVGPVGLVDGLPVGYSDSAEGAEAAAARFALVSFGVLDGRISAAPRTIAAVYGTPAYRPTLQMLLQATAAQREAHASELSELAVRRAILGTRLVSYSANRATVETWEYDAAMLGRPPVTSSQIVQRFELERSHGDWKVAGAGTSEEQLAQMSAQQRAEILSTFIGRGDASPGY